MNVLHIYDDATGGATVAMESVASCVGGSMQPLQQPVLSHRAICTVGGYCHPGRRLWIRGALRMHKPDIVHLHNFKHAGTAAIAACKDAGIPVVWSCYDYWCLGPHDIGNDWSWATYRPVNRTAPRILNLALIGRQRRMRRWFNQLDAIVTLSKHSMGMLLWAGITRPAYHVVPLPVTVPRRLAEWESDDTFEPTRNPNLVLYVGGHSAHKGWGVWRKVVELLQAGDPWPACLSIHKATRSQSLGEIARATCLVVPEIWPNPGPVVIAEAQLLGTPVVASNIGGIPEMHPTFLAKHDSPEDFAAKVRNALAMGGHSADLARIEATRRHDPATIRQQFLEVYRSCVSR